jgi:nucleotide-binding universal stress UspA family protein
LAFRANGRLFRHIHLTVPMLSIDDLLVARDYSSVSDRAFRYALDLAARTGATLHVLYADVLHEADSDSQRDRSPAGDLDTFREELKQAGAVSAEALDAVSITEEVRRDVSPAPAILSYAAEAGVDLIALGTHGRRGPSRILLGSVAEEVVRRADRPVFTVRGEEEDRPAPSPEAIERILVPVDFSDFSREALRAAKEWATLYDATIDTLHVIAEALHPAYYVGGVESIYDMHPDIEETVQQRLDTFESETSGPEVEVRSHVRVGNAAPDIVEFVDEEGIDLVTMSTHGRTGLDRFLLGSVAEKIVRHVRCPVVTMKAFGRSVTAPAASATDTAES